jgi:adenosylcobyric acid synthase
LSFADAVVRGYEIHCGVSRGAAMDAPLCRLDDGRSDGVVSRDGQILATYLHGLFDHPEALRALLECAGVRNAEPLDIRTLRDASLERLADTVEAHLDTRALRALLGIAA